MDLVAKEAEAIAAKGGKPSPPQANAARSRAAAKRALDRAAKLRASKPESPPPHHHLTLSPTIDTAIVGALLRAYQDAVKTVQAHEQLNEASQLEQEFPSKESEGSADRNRNELQKGHEDKDLNIADDLALAMVASNLLAQLPNAGGWPLVGEKTGRIQEWLLDFEEPDPAHRHWCGVANSTLALTNLHLTYKRPEILLFVSIPIFPRMKQVIFCLNFTHVLLLCALMKGRACGISFRVIFSGDLVHEHHVLK